MTPAIPSPARDVEAVPLSTLHGWRLWVALALLASFYAALPAVERAANDHRRQSAAQGE